MIYYNFFHLLPRNDARSSQIVVRADHWLNKECMSTCHGIYTIGYKRKILITYCISICNFDRAKKIMQFCPHILLYKCKLCKSPPIHEKAHIDKCKLSRPQKKKKTSVLIVNVRISLKKFWMLEILKFDLLRKANRKCMFLVCPSK